MARFRTKPFEIEAVQFDGTNFEEVGLFVGHREVDPEYKICNFQQAGTFQKWDSEEIVGEVYDKLHSTWVGVKEGQWIIKGSKGEFYPCDPEIFESKYERVFTEDEKWATYERADGSKVRVPRKPFVESDTEVVYVEESADPIAVREVKYWEQMNIDD